MTDWPTPNCRRWADGSDTLPILKVSPPSAARALEAGAIASSAAATHMKMFGRL